MGFASIPFIVLSSGCFSAKDVGIHQPSSPPFENTLEAVITFPSATSLPYAGAELFQTSGTISGLPFSARDVTAGTVSVGTILTLQP